MSEATPAELDRMMLSRRTLHGYLRAGSDARIGPEMIAGEIAILQGFIAKYPDKAGTLGALIAEWRALVRGVVN